MTVYFTKNDDLILFYINMKKLNMFNFLHFKMMKFFSNYQTPLFCLGDNEKCAYLCMFLRKYSFKTECLIQKHLFSF